MDNNLGLGVMIGLLAGNDQSVTDFKRSIDRTITELTLGEDDALHFVFDDGYKMKLFDDGQSCCENRYMTCGDDLSHFVGAKLLGAETRELPTVEDEYGEPHDVQMLIVKTSLGEFTCETHNEHNGYYGGFLVRAASE